MITQLTNTNARDIMAALGRERLALGPASGMVLTLIVMSSPEHFVGVFSAAMEAGRAHPSRIIVCSCEASSATGLDADLHFGEQLPGDLIVLKFKGELVAHADSVVLPLLLPDAPAVVWWPNEAPDDPSSDPVGALALRRITDAAGTDDPLAAIAVRAAHACPGDTDLTWTRVTPWRALLAAALDQHPCTPTAAVVEAAADNAPAALLAAWLRLRLDVPVEQVATEGPGITGVRLETASGEVAIVREDGFMATWIVPGQVNRSVALKRRSVPQLITEELQRMDPDDVLAEVLTSMRQES